MICTGRSSSRASVLRRIECRLDAGVPETLGTRLRQLERVRTHTAQSPRDLRALHRFRVHGKPHRAPVDGATVGREGQVRCCR